MPAKPKAGAKGGKEKVKKERPPRKQRVPKEHPTRPYPNENALSLTTTPTIQAPAEPFELQYSLPECRTPASLPEEWPADDTLESMLPSLPTPAPFFEDPKTEQQVQDPKLVAEYEKLLAAFVEFWGNPE